MFSSINNIFLNYTVRPPNVERDGCSVARNTTPQSLANAHCSTNQGIKIVYAFMAKSGAQTLTFQSVTNKHTQKLHVFGRSGGG